MSNYRLVPQIFTLTKVKITPIYHYHYVLPGNTKSHGCLPCFLPPVYNQSDCFFFSQQRWIMVDRREFVAGSAGGLLALAAGDLDIVTGNSS